MKIKSQKLARFSALFNKNKRFRLIVIVALCVMIVALLSIFSFFMTRIDSAGKVTAAIAVEPENLDPTFCADRDTETILVNCFEGLMRVDEEGEAVKAAASDYTVSGDGKVYTFTISSSARWSDGTAVEASDFVYAWQRTANPYNASPYAYLFENIVGYDDVLADFEKEQNKETNEEGNYVTVDMTKLWVRAADSKTLVVKLKEKDPSFLMKCTSVAFLPLCEDVVRPNTRIWSTDPDMFVSNGAFTLSSWTPGSYLDLVPNEDFRDGENVKLKSIRFYFVSDADRAYEMFKNSDVLYSGVFSDETFTKAEKKKTFTSYDELGSYFLYFNQAEAPFNDVRVRRALTLAIDRVKLVEETAYSRGKPAGALISDGFSSFRENGEEYFDPYDTEANIEKAQELLAQAGYKNGKGFPDFEYLYNDNTFSRETAELLAKMWEENLGIECVMKSVSWSKLDEMRRHGNFTVAKGGMIAPYNDELYILEQFTSDNNFCSWQNDEYDNLVLQMMADSSNASHKAEKILMEDWVVCPLYYYVNGYLASKRMDNFYVTDSGVAYFMYADVNVL
ncbi:MAG: peptide ABC transporter substrate-binding protein [Ruminococcaceae bacterium]|nr:peptide ABC transporter substrate-binding protein [Oscillospiraceae bacterium]